MLNAFRFSRKLQIEAKHQRDTSGIEVENEVFKSNCSSVPLRTPLRHNPIYLLTQFNFLDRLASETAERMTDKLEFLLPFFHEAMCICDIC